MTATARVLPDGSVAVTDGGVTYAPLSPDAVQAVAAKAQASADAGRTQQLTEALIELAGLLSEVGACAEASLTVTATAGCATVDRDSFNLAQERFPDGTMNAQYEWVAGPMTISRASRTVADGVTVAGDGKVTSASAAFGQDDVHRPISGGSIPTGAVITACTDAQTVTVTPAPTADGTGVSLTIG